MAFENRVGDNPTLYDGWGCLPHGIAIIINNKNNNNNIYL